MLDSDFVSITSTLLTCCFEAKKELELKLGIRVVGRFALHGCGFVAVAPSSRDLNKNKKRVNPDEIKLGFENIIRLRFL